MIQPPCVLPSNASPLVGGIDSTPRVLQEHSGNRQHGDYRYTQDHEQKYPVALLSENAHPRMPLKAEPLFRPQYTAQHAPFRSGYARPNYGRSHYSTPAEKDARARSLLRRFHSSEGYAKYRSKQVKQDEKNGEQKWPDQLEQAFFRALVEYPPMGRKKHLFKEKQRGRNELIADWIEMATGINRNRKQVSSHIQVLKPFVEKDPIIMAYLSKLSDSDTTPKYIGGYFSSHASGRGLSRYPVQAPPQSRRHMLPHPTHAGAGRHDRLREMRDIFEPIDFEMFVQRKLGPADDTQEEQVERLHTYTKRITQDWEPEEAFSDMTSFAQRHPNLAAIHARHPIDCNVIAAQASLALRCGPWKARDGDKADGAGIELGISFHCRVKELPRPYELSCMNQFYENGQLADRHTEVFPFADAATSLDIQAKFGSMFWVGALSAKYKEAREAGPESGAAFIASITATQEIFIKTAIGTERVMLIHWNFRESTRETGRVAWRRVVVPPTTSAPHYGSPLKSVDTPFNFNEDPMPNLTASGAPPQPTLQSPFEYDSGSGSGSGSGSALSSATWPTSISDGQFTNIGMEVNLDSTFDFSGDGMDIPYDPNLTLDSFDTSTFSFDAPAEDFVADPAMQDYSQAWVGSYTGSFDGQQSFAEPSYTMSTVIDSQNSAFGDYGVFDPQIYGTGAESQAFVAGQDVVGGAGQDVINVKEEVVLDVTADPGSTFAAPVIETQEPV